MSYVYLKSQSRTRRRFHRPHLERKYRRAVAASLFLSGFSLFASAVFPILNYQLEYSGRFNQILNPLSSRFYNQGNHVLGSNTADYTQLSNWFTSNSAANPDQLLSSQTETVYHLAIPALKITDALVTIGGNDLKKTLVQYPQTALPGQLGNTVVFGHSILPQFFNPKSYMTIFSTLYRLKTGDEINLTFDNVSYKYLVEDIYETLPSDLSVLEQRFDGRFLTLITCTPPGTYIRRLVIKAQVVDN